MVVGRSSTFCEQSELSNILTVSLLCSNVLLNAFVDAIVLRLLGIVIGSSRI